MRYRLTNGRVESILYAASLNNKELVLAELHAEITRALASAMREVLVLWNAHGEAGDIENLAKGMIEVEDEPSQHDHWPCHFHAYNSLPRRDFEWSGARETVLSVEFGVAADQDDHTSTYLVVNDWGGAGFLALRWWEFKQVPQRETINRLCICPATSEYDPPCPTHGIRPIGQRPDGSYPPGEFTNT